MLIVITPELTVNGEPGILNNMFYNGLRYLHIRKYAFSDSEIRSYVNSVQPDFRKYLVLHSHYHLADELGIKRLHFSEQGRKAQSHVMYKTGFLLSTSVHSIKDFNDLGKEWSYAFISPVFPSISKKGYGTSSDLLDKLKTCSTEDVIPVALGGINSDNIPKLLTSGIDSVALLGAVWEDKDQLAAFLKCQRVYREFKDNKI